MTFKTKNARSFVIALLTVFVGWLLGSWSGATPQARSVDPSVNRVRELLKDRVATLRELADGIGKFGNSADTYRANLAVLYAEFELCGSAKDRLAILEKIVDMAKQHEQQIAGVGGVVPTGTLRRAKLSRLDAEIGLERFKVNNATSAK